MATALVTGGAGYIGSHATLLLLKKGWDVVVLDDFSNSCIESLNRVEMLANKKVTVCPGSILNKALLGKVFSEYSIDVVYHFAGWKAVGESMSKPVDYYYNNVAGTLSLLNVMKEHKVFRLIFSSSATVYGVPESVPITEQAPTQTTNPYGESKLVIENILKDIAKLDPRWTFAILRYFNPVGAHESGVIGEDPNGIPNNLVPFVSQVAVGKQPMLKIYGNDYNTPDGTGVRDYIHVMDLIEGHIMAWEFIKYKKGVHTFNLGTGKGYSVFDVVKIFKKISGKDIPYEIRSRRLGDIAICYADPGYAEKTLGWKAHYSLEEMLRDSWTWQLNNPNGYR